MIGNEEIAPFLLLLVAVLGIWIHRYVWISALAPPAGFLRVTVVEGVMLSPGAKPWSLGVGFPNVVTGIFILGILHPEHARTWRELGEILKRVAPVFLAWAIANLFCCLPTPRWHEANGDAPLRSVPVC